MAIPGLISILVPFKNVSLYLSDCLDSISQQTYENWEVIAIDDHSTDQSRDLINVYEESSPQFKCFSNTGSGIIDALRLALDKSSGEYVTRMDADDMMPVNKLETLLGLIKNRTEHIATGKVRYFPKNRISNGYLKYEGWINSLTESNRYFSEIYKECVIPSPCWLARKSDLIKAGGFNSGKMPEDYDLCFRFYRENFKVAASDQVLHYWRDHSERTSRTSTDYAIEKFTTLKLDYFLDLEVGEEETIVLWSAGKWGKDLAKRLHKKNRAFHWVCTNEKKIGNQVYGQEIFHYETAPQQINPKVIIPIASAKYQNMIKAFFKPYGLIERKDLFFFL